MAGQQHLFTVANQDGMGTGDRVFTCTLTNASSPWTSREYNYISAGDSMYNLTVSGVTYYLHEFVTNRDQGEVLIKEQQKNSARYVQFKDGGSTWTQPMRFYASKSDRSRTGNQGERTMFDYWAEKQYFRMWSEDSQMSVKSPTFFRTWACDLDGPISSDSAMPPSIRAISSDLDTWCTNRFTQGQAQFVGAAAKLCPSALQETITIKVCESNAALLDTAACKTHCLGKKGSVSDKCVALLQKHCGSADAVTSKSVCKEVMASKAAWGHFDEPMGTYCAAQGKGSGSDLCGCLDKAASAAYFEHIPDEDLRRAISGRPDCFYPKCAEATTVYKNSSQMMGKGCPSITICKNHVENVVFAKGSKNNNITLTNDCNNNKVTTPSSQSSSSVMGTVVVGVVVVAVVACALCVAFVMLMGLGIAARH